MNNAAGKAGRDKRSSDETKKPGIPDNIGDSEGFGASHKPKGAGRMRSRLRRTLRSWRRPRQLIRGASVQLLVDGAQFMPAIEQALDSAQTQILIENYMIGSDDTGKRIVDLLCRKAMQGVHVWAVFDAVGSTHLSNADRKRMTDAGVHLQMFNPFRLLRPLRSFFRNHRRIIVVDGQVGFIGGFGFTDEWIKEGYRGGPWHELVWQVQGSPLRPMSEVFAQGWPKNCPVPMPVTDHADDMAYWPISKSRLHSRRLRATFYRLIRRSRQRAWLCTSYFVPSLRLTAALRHAARRGVDVRLIVPGRKTDYKIVLYAGRRHYQTLLKAGVKIYESRDHMMHAKAAIFDQNLSLLGSSNLDNWSLHYNKEFNLALVSRRAVNDLEKAMLDIQAVSTHITLEAWRNRPWLNRLLESSLGIADDLL